MADPLTAGVLVGLAVQKFVESGAGELAKKFTTEAIGFRWNDGESGRGGYCVEC
jgi:hypothetical protein